ncbi:MAG: hypothetical protein COZ75_09630 [Flavobacteriaceae bacterium CG_4_8_14_3_um_filter_34_10]|nr:MAG: hypothetical protein AUK33_02465 [Flavobacteriaceae bacterium CG2_30_34_30]PIQ17555.1 MAG: hypothetical protein COW66_11065 [Flavobacteriaceae bacterium CG18_big_fil_WC_8_21_14_2_50_34_36]PIV49717.1 MAG: hypothetical protein COS19_07205 [Flavobacteriaceae bacterium CG02_land_8_20_14_3_00_34_13]PIX08899.1 MAG: hypothetical protein COZ75_09630 [Flavobacteriaceae bacterium CG_4_8_14_3_um_filter_34_10]PJC06179.1 MAG: hypothetical protein CO068_12520 [Flavobacteriaceae bacterium CG_4_9_14_0_
MKYHAFISYSHRQDDTLGANLEKALEKFAKPTFKRRALQIFRDANDLSAAADLGEKIKTGLLESEYFIFMASQASAQSKWCQREVALWREHKSMDNFLIALTDGDIFYDETTSDFDWTRTTALPKNLSGAFAGEPLYTDFRTLSAKEEQTLKNINFEGKIVHIAATLHKKSIGDMVGEAVKQHKRTIRLRNAAISVLSVLLVIAIIASFIAVRQKDKALLSTYIAHSQAQFNQDPTKSLRLAEYAYEFAKRKNLPVKDASEQLIKVFYSGFGFYQKNLETDFQFQENPSDFLTDNELYKYFKEIAENIKKGIPDGFYLGKAEDFHFNPTTNQAIYLLSGTEMPFPKIYFMQYDTNNGTTQIDSVDIKLDGFSGYTAYVQDIEISPDGKYSLLGFANSKTALIENEAYHDIHIEKNIFKDRSILKTKTNYPVSNVAFSEDATFMVTLSYDTEIENEFRKNVDSTYYYWKKEPFSYMEIRNSETEHQNISLDGNYYMQLTGEEKDPYFWFHYAQKIYFIDHNEIMEFPDAIAADITKINSSDGQFSANYKGVFNAEKELLIRLDVDIIDNPGIALCFSTDNQFLKVSYLGGVQRIFALNPEFIIDRINSTEIMGTISNLDQKDKTRFLIKE